MPRVWVSKRLAAVTLLGCATTSFADEKPDLRRGPAAAMHQAERAGEGVTVKVAADAPRPLADADRMKKTQMQEFKGVAAKDQIKDLENKIYTLEKPGATIWAYLDDERGDRKRDVGYVQRQMDELNAALSAVKQANSAWHRLSEYEKRVDFLRRVGAAHAAHYGAVATAKVEAVAAAEKAVQDAWEAKRVQDDGVQGERHKAHVGKVVAAATPLAAGDERTPLTPTFDADAPLHLRAYSNESGWNAMHRAGVDCGATEGKLDKYMYQTVMRVGATGDWYTLEDRVVDKATFSKKTQLEVTTHGDLTAGGQFKNEDEATAPFAWVTRVVPRLKPGPNLVEVEVRAWCYGGTHHGAVLANTQFSVNATVAQLEAVAKRASFKMTASVHGAEALRRIRGKVATHFSNNNMDLLDFRTASEWQPVRHAISGVVLHRAANAVAVVRYKDSTRCEAVSIVLEEPYDGQTYGPALNFGSALYRPFVCNVK